MDAAGVTTPGAIAITYFAAYIPSGQEQYVSYTTAQATGAKLGTITRPTFEEGGGTLTSAAAGQYQYTMSAKAPQGFDATVTTTVAISASRNLTQFSLGTNYAGATFNFVPNGSVVAVTRDVIRTSSCNTCLHDQLAFHGGHAFGMQQCVMCHQPQNADPVTGNTLDLKVMAHKIHMGSQLPSVVGTSTTLGVPYQIAGYRGAISDFSTVVDPADPRRCEVCHSQTTGAAQAAAYKTEPSATLPAAPVTTMSISPPAPITPADSSRTTTSAQIVISIHHCAQVLFAGIHMAERAVLRVGSSSIGSHRRVEDIAEIDVPATSGQP